jgi:hypothetical protein
MNNTYVPLAQAAELAYRELAGVREPSIHPLAIEAAAAALSAFVPIHPGEVVERTELEAGLEKLRRAGVCFSEVAS